jgi:predicted HTH domain antitoxin
MTTVGVRLGKELEKAIGDVKKEESIDKSTAVRMLMNTGYKEWRLRKAIDQLRADKVTLWEASRISGMPLWDFIALLKKEEGIEWAEFDPRDELQSQKRQR